MSGENEGARAEQKMSDAERDRLASLLASINRIGDKNPMMMYTLLDALGSKMLFGFDAAVTAIRTLVDGINDEIPGMGDIAALYIVEKSARTRIEGSNKARDAKINDPSQAGGEPLPRLNSVSEAEAIGGKIKARADYLMNLFEGDAERVSEIISKEVGHKVHTAKVTKEQIEAAGGDLQSLIDTMQFNEQMDLDGATVVGFEEIDDMDDTPERREWQAKLVAISDEPNSGAEDMAHKLREHMKLDAVVVHTPEQLKILQSAEHVRIRRLGLSPDPKMLGAALLFGSGGPGTYPCIFIPSDQVPGFYNQERIAKRKANIQRQREGRLNAFAHMSPTPENRKEQAKSGAGASIGSEVDPEVLLQAEALRAKREMQAAREQERMAKPLDLSGGFDRPE